MTHQISGKLAGTYETVLASSSAEGKRLVAVLCINEENSYGTHFNVQLNGKQQHSGQNLAAAIRFYDNMNQNPVPGVQNPDTRPQLPAGIDWTPEVWERFRVHYTKAMARGFQADTLSFKFSGLRFTPGFAKLLLDTYAPEGKGE